MLNLKTAVMCAALSASCLVAGVGCKGMMGGGDSASTPANMDTSNMSKDQLMTQGQTMVNQGQAMQTNASALPDGTTAPDGMSKDDMMAKAKVLIQKGMAMMDKAKSM